jgi:ABC-type multidrug transport system ATPase subunit
MVALASIAAANAPILVLDEPTVGLDAAHTAQVMTWLAERHAAGTTVMLITHDMELAARADRALVMRGGRIAADGPPADVFFQVETLRQAGLEPPFAVQLALGLGRPALAADLSPEGAARAWLEAIRMERAGSSATRQTLAASTPGRSAHRRNR